MKSNNYTNFKHMVNGPSYFTSYFKGKGTVVRVRTGECSFWNRDVNNLVALNLNEHEYVNDVYIFCMMDMEKSGGYMLGWIFFDELIYKAQPIFEDDTIYLTIPIKELHHMKKLVGLSKNN